MVRIKGPFYICDIGESREARPLECVDHAQPLAYEGTIYACQRHNVRDRRKAHKIKLCQQLRFGNGIFRKPAFKPQGARDGHQGQKRYATCTKLSQARVVIRSIGIHVCQNRRISIHRVMIKHDNIQPQRVSSGEGLLRRSTTIDCD